MRHIGMWMLVLLGVGAHAGAPRYAASLTDFSAGGDVSAAQRRVRVSVTTESGMAERGVRLGRLYLCAGPVCYQARTPGYVDVASTAGGNASLIADVLVAPTTFTAIYFAEPGGSRDVRGELALAPPLVIDAEFYGREVLVVLRKQGSGGQEHFMPVASASNYFRPEFESVFYQPHIATIAVRNRSTHLTLPAHALPQPYVFVSQCMTLASGIRWSISFRTWCWRSRQRWMSPPLSIRPTAAPVPAPASPFPRRARCALVSSPMPCQRRQIDE